MKRLAFALSPFTATFIASAAAAQTPAPPNCAGARDIRLVNGKIATMDAKNSIVSEVTIQDGVITGVGKSSGRLSPCTRVVDLKGRTAVPGLDRQPQPHRAARPAARTRHAARDRGVDCRRAGADQGQGEDGARGRVHHGDGRLELRAVRREASADAAGARRRRFEPSGHRVSVVHGTGGGEHAGQGVLRRQGHRRQRRRRHRHQRAVARRARRAARRPDVRRSEARHAGRAGVLRQRRRHHERGHGRVHHPRAAGHPGLVRRRHPRERRSVPDVRRARVAAPRRTRCPCACASSSCRWTRGPTCRC